MKDGTQVGEITDYDGFRIRVLERWEPGVLNSEKHLGYRAEWKNDTTGESDSAELFRSEEQARRHAESEIRRSEQRKFQTYLIPLGVRPSPESATENFGRVRFAAWPLVRQTVPINGKSYRVVSAPADIQRAPKVLVKGTDGKVLNDDEPARIVYVVEVE